jgi:hypothetical protein
LTPEPGGVPRRSWHIAYGLRDPAGGPVRVITGAARRR